MDISIIVPIYNVKPYLSKCLDSILPLTQQLEVEVFLLDDGSTDGSSEIALRFAQEHPAFSYHRRENCGIGSTRNYGVTLACGTYLLFVDSDDVIDAATVVRMFTVAQRNGTDLAICDVARLKDGILLKSEIHLRALHNLSKSVTHITEHPSLVYDVTAWNKLILRSFYLENNFSFPVGHMYEDMPWSIPLHYHANGVSVVRQTGYFWRIRFAGESSITQKLTDQKALLDKIKMSEQIFSYIDQYIPNPQIRFMLEIKTLCIDYLGYLNAITALEPEPAMEMLGWIAAFWERCIHPETCQKLPLIYQQIASDVLHRDLSHLIRTMNYKRLNYSNAPLEETAQGARILLPAQIFTIPNRGAENDFCWTPARSRILRAEVEDGALVLEGYIYQKKLNIAPGEQEVQAWLMGDVSGQKLELSTIPAPCPELTAEQGRMVNCDDYRIYSCTYDGTGFRIRIEPPQLEAAGLEPGPYLVLIRHRNRFTDSTRLLRGAAAQARAVISGYNGCSGSLTVKADFDSRSSLQLVLRETPS